jgi:DNA-binding beta-propeller fold protein YncE
LRHFGSAGSEQAQFREPRGLVVDDSGQVIVADSGNHRIQVFGPGGSFLRSFGSRGKGEGELSSPSNVAIAEGKIIVEDAGNRRVRVFDDQGEVLNGFGGQGEGAGQFRDQSGVAVCMGGNIAVCDYSKVHGS